MKKKEKSTLLTEAQRLNARSNIRAYTWAKIEADAVIANADLWASKSDDELWAFIPGCTLHRYIHVNTTSGCPECGPAVFDYGNYGWITDPLETPWKVICPSCDEVFPKNDFGAFYRSGLDDKGIFRHDRAERSLLFNADHPDPGDPLHMFGVDDETGWEGYTFIRYYTHWGIWCGVKGPFSRSRRRPLAELSRAYALTGDAAYAHKAAVLLDRIADVYGDMDYLAQGDHCNEGSGGVFSAIWETFFLSSVADAYDRVFDGIVDDAALVEFLAAKAVSLGLHNPKACFGDIQSNIEDQLLRPGKEKIFTGEIWANATVHHETYTRLTLVLDDDRRDNDLEQVLFKGMPILPRGELHQSASVNGLLEKSLKKDGSGYESVGYHVCFSSLVPIAKLLADHSPDYIPRLLPRYESYFTYFVDLTCIDRYYPHIGDSWNTGGPNFPLDPKITSFPNLEAYIDAFRLYRNPRMAQFIHFLCAGALDGIHGDVFEDDPESIRDEIRDAVARAGPMTWTSCHFTGYGLIILRNGDEAENRAAWLSYAAPPTHGHRDSMSIGLFAKGLNLMPDFGYPEYTGGGGAASDKRRHAWTSNTIAHNVVVVNRKGQIKDAGGVAEMFERSPFVKVACARGSDNYAETDVYDRDLVLVDIDDGDGYMVDVFRVRGGDDHMYSFHSAEGAVKDQGLQLRKQDGTLAGQDIPYAELPMTHGGPWDFPEEDRSGYDYLYHVERDTNPQQGWSVDWAITDTWGVLEQPCDVHLKLTMLSDVDDVVLADGDPPQLGKGNARRLKFVLAHREGKNIESCFVSIIEPYREAAMIADIARRPVTTSDGALSDWEGVALEVQHSNGAKDTVLNLSRSVQDVRCGDVTFSGRMAILRRSADGKPVRALLLDVSAFAIDGQEIFRSVQPAKELSIEWGEDGVKIEGG